MKISSGHDNIYPPLKKKKLHHINQMGNNTSNQSENSSEHSAVFGADANADANTAKLSLGTKSARTLMGSDRDLMCQTALWVRADMQWTARSLY